MIPNRLLWRIFLPILGIVCIPIAGLSIYTTHALARFYQAQTREHLTDIARLVALRLQAWQSALDLNEACKQIAGLVNVRLTIIAPSGHVLADSHQDPDSMEDHSARQEVRQALARGIGWASRVSPTIGMRMDYAAILAQIQGLGHVVVRTAIPAAAVHRALLELYRQILAISLAAVGLAVVLSLVLARQISRPILAIQDAANSFSEGRFDLRAPQSGPTEIRQLARSFNDMATLLQERITTINRQNAQLEAVLAAMVEGLIAVDQQGRIVAANRSAGRFLVTDVEKAVGTYYAQAIALPQLQQAIHKLLSTSQSQNLDEQIQLTDGRSYVVHGTKFGVGPAGPVAGLVVTIYDVTELRRLEQIRKDFVANVSHELKTPITAIKGFVEMLLESDLVDVNQLKKYLAIISRHTDRLNAIINDLSTLTRLEEEQRIRRMPLELVNVRQIIEDSIELVRSKASERSIQIELACDGQAVVRANPTLLQQAIVNLLDNAIKYSPSDQKVQVKVTRDNTHLSIQVVDHGCGIPAEHLDRIFERFYVVDKARSRQLGGTGLGLAIVKHIIQLHGGTIQVQSEVGKGSTFTVNLAT
ncbi:MAG: ATP-binding protein [Sedimentisphaerales bacterium]|jgi:two-component system phosphate regulon sensor histidine kinase PhoR|nr:ATP-binding protein [Sedimentisphaerales bacterium]